MRKSTLEFVAGREALYMLDSVTEHTEKRLISSGEKMLNSTDLMYSRGGKVESAIAHVGCTVRWELVWLHVDKSRMNNVCERCV
uniref:Uncharacterized protein n=1 Tax=viral metagenome TaxID=1070528 RepID=A0A6C0C244_9ZZZZ